MKGPALQPEVLDVEVTIVIVIDAADSCKSLRSACSILCQKRNIPFRQNGVLHGTLGSSPKNLRPCENHTRFSPTAMRESHAILAFSHGRRFFELRNVQKRATKSDTSGHCLLVLKSNNFSEDSNSFGVLEPGWKLMVAYSPRLFSCKL